MCARRGNLWRTGTPSRNEIWRNVTKWAKTTRGVTVCLVFHIIMDHFLPCGICITSYSLLPCLGTGCHTYSFQIAASLCSSQWHEIGTHFRWFIALNWWSRMREVLWNRSNRVKNGRFIRKTRRFYDRFVLILILDSNIESRIPCATHTRSVRMHAAPSHAESDAPLAL